MSREHMMDVHRRYNDVINQGNLDLIDEIFTPNYVDHEHASPELHGPESLKQFLTTFRAAFPGGHVTVEDWLVDGNRLVARWTMRGTRQGEFAGMPPPGKAVTITGIAIHRFADDKIEESWDYYDALGLRQQLGAILPAK